MAPTIPSSPPANVKVDRLPICDLLFCIISLLILLAEGLALTITILYTYHNANEIGIVYFALLISFFAFGSLSVTVISMNWYLKRNDESHGATSKDLGVHVCLHFFQLSLIWRYLTLCRRIRWDVAKLFICELCSLRAIHAFLLSTPFCLILAYFIFTHWFQVPILISVTCALCYVDICWSLCAFNRKCSRSNADDFVLCWPSILAQFFWRLGTVGSRLTALTLYASLHGYFVGLVILFHLLVTLLALTFIAPANQKLKTRLLNALRLSFVYVLFFYNPSKYRTKLHFFVYYCVVFLENSLLTAVWLISTLYVDGRWTTMHTFVTIFVWFNFAFGIFWMLIYYRYLHVNVLKSKFLQPNHVTVSKTTMTSSTTINENDVNFSNITENNNNVNIRPVVFACSAQLPFRKQPSKFKAPPLTASASSTCVPKRITQHTVTVELVEQRRSRSVPSTNRKRNSNSDFVVNKEDRGNNREDDSMQLSARKSRQHFHSYPKRLSVNTSDNVINGDAVVEDNSAVDFTDNNFDTKNNTLNKKRIETVF